MQGRNAANDEPLDALYRACRRYEELYTKAIGNRAYEDALEHAFNVIVTFWMHRESNDDPLSTLPRDVVARWAFNMAAAFDVLLWAGAIMTEIENRRVLRGRGTGQSAAIL